MNKDRIFEVAVALLESEGTRSAGASAGERVIAALAVGRPEWGGYTLPGKATNVLAMIDRIGPSGVALVRELWDELH